MRTSSTETQRSLWDSDEESLEERRRREDDLWSDHADSDFHQRDWRPPSPSSPSLPPPPQEDDDDEDDLNNIIDVVVQTAVDASMEFAKRVFQSAPLVTAPVPPYVASYPQCQCYDIPHPPALPFQQQAMTMPPPPPPPPPQTTPMPAAQEYLPPPPSPYHYNDAQQQTPYHSSTYIRMGDGSLRYIYMGLDRPNSYD